MNNDKNSPTRRRHVCTKFNENKYSETKYKRTTTKPPPVLTTIKLPSTLSPSELDIQTKLLQIYPNKHIPIIRNLSLKKQSTLPSTMSEPLDRLDRDNLKQVANIQNSIITNAFNTSQLRNNKMMYINENESTMKRIVINHKLPVHIIGDIEGNVEIFQQTLTFINNNISTTSRFIFLGDIHNCLNETTTIEHIKQILYSFNDHLPSIFENGELKQFITKDTTNDEIKNMFRVIWFKNELNKLDQLHMDHYKYKPNVIEQFDKEFKVEFILGNKEVAFLRDMIESKIPNEIDESKNESKNETKDGETTELKEHRTFINNFTVPIRSMMGAILENYYNEDTNEAINDFTTDNITYSVINKSAYKGTRYTVKGKRTLTNEQLNIMYCYLSLCRMYILLDDILITHSYRSTKMFSNINLTICGHSKAYGLFKDEYSQTGWGQYINYQPIEDISNETGLLVYHQATLDSPTHIIFDNVTKFNYNHVENTTTKPNYRTTVCKAVNVNTNELEILGNVFIIDQSNEDCTNSDHLTNFCTYIGNEIRLYANDNSDKVKSHMRKICFK